SLPGSKNSLGVVFSSFRLPGDSWADDVFTNDLPYVSIVPVCWGGREPSGSFQGFGCLDCFISVPGGPGAVIRDIPSADGVFVPALHQPIEQLLCVVELFSLLFGRYWSPPIQPLKNRCQSLSLLLGGVCSSCLGASQLSMGSGFLGG